MIFHDVPPCSEWNADQWKSIIIYVDKQRGLTQGRLCPKAAAQCSTRCHPNLRSLVLQSDRINYKQKGASKPIEMTPAKPPLQTRYARSSSMPGWLSGNYQTRTFHLFAVHRFTAPSNGPSLKISGSKSSAHSGNQWPKQKQQTRVSCQWRDVWISTKMRIHMEIWPKFQKDKKRMKGMNIKTAMGTYDTYVRTYINSYHTIPLSSFHLSRCIQYTVPV